MAVYQGVRLRSAALPSATASPARPGASPSGTHAGARVRPAGIFMAAILTGTLLGLVYLTGTLGSSATSSEIGDLGGERTALDQDLALQEIQVIKLTEADAIIEAAKDLGLRKLGHAVVLKAP